MLTKEDKTEMKMLLTRETGVLMEHVDDRFKRIIEAIDSMRESLNRHINESNERSQKFENEMAFMRGNLSLHDKRISQLEAK